MTADPARVLSAFSLAGRSAVVTGAGRGIGLGIAGLLAGAGASVTLADIDLAAAEAGAGALRAEGLDATAAPLDVAASTEVEQVAADVVARTGRLDVWVNNAAIITDGWVLDTDEATLDRVHAVNFKGTFFGCQAAGRIMAEQGRGSIVNIVSGAIDVATPTLVCYATAKAAAAQLSRTLAAELGPQGVRVNAVAPGWIDTPMNERHVRNDEGVVDADRKAALVAARSRMSPLGLTGEPDDIAWAVLYLASDAARFVTGQVLRPNGGATMPW